MSSRVLNALIAIQLLLGTAWTLPMVTGAYGTFSSVGLAFYLLPPIGVLAMLGAWVAWRRPAWRRRGIVLAVAAPVFFVLPEAVMSTVGRPLTAADFAGTGLAVLAVLAVVTIVIPARVAGILPTRLYTSTLFNWLVVVCQALIWLLSAGVFGWIATSLFTADGPRDTDVSGMAIAWLLGVAGLAAMAIGFISGLGFLHGYVGLRGNVAGACRRLHWTQVAIGTPGILLAAGAFYVGARIALDSA